MAAQRAMVQKDPKDILYVLNYRYRGGHDSAKLKKKLKAIGWNKVTDMTACYVTKKKPDEDEDIQREVTRVLQEEVDTSLGSEVRFGISEYIPPNQRPSNYDGIDTLFDGYY